MAFWVPFYFFSCTPQGHKKHLARNQFKKWTTMNFFSITNSWIKILKGRTWKIQIELLKFLSDGHPNGNIAMNKKYKHDERKKAFYCLVPQKKSYEECDRAIKNVEKKKKFFSRYFPFIFRISLTSYRKIVGRSWDIFSQLQNNDKLTGKLSLKAQKKLSNLLIPFSKKHFLR